MSVGPSEEKAPSTGRLWWETTRPKTLFAALAPVGVGASMAWTDGPPHVPVLAATLAIAVLVQIGTNFCNDVFDHLQGADTEKRQGPRRGLHSGRISLRGMIVATAGCFLGVAGLSALLVARGGLPVVALAAASIACGIGYTCGRASLAYTGLADVFVVMFFGPVAAGGTYYLQLPGGGWPPPEVWIAGLGPGLIATGLLTVNNLRDVEEDRENRKRTLAVRFGPGFARREYVFCVKAALATPALAAWVAGHGWAAALVALLVFRARPAIERVRTGSTGAELNPALGMTGKLLWLYTLVFVATWPLGGTGGGL